VKILSWQFFLILKITGFWLALSGYYSLNKPVIAILGLFSVVICFALVKKMQMIKQNKPIYFSPSSILYFLWLIGQMFKSAFSVFIAIWKNENIIHPNFIKIKTEPTTEEGKVLLANSLTLTPGTFSIILSGNEILLHALLAENEQSIEMDVSKIGNKIAQLENEKKL